MSVFTDFALFVLAILSATWLEHQKTPFSGKAPPLRPLPDGA